MSLKFLFFTGSCCGSRDDDVWGQGSQTQLFRSVKVHNNTRALWYLTLEPWLTWFSSSFRCVRFLFSSCGVSFYNCNSLLNKLWSLVLDPSNTQNKSFFMMSAVSVYFHECFEVLLQGYRTFSPIDLQSHCIFFSFTPTHDTLTGSWIFKCIIAPSFMYFLFSSIIRSLDHIQDLFLFVYHIISLMLVQARGWQCYINNSVKLSQ